MDGERTLRGGAGDVDTRGNGFSRRASMRLADDDNERLLTTRESDARFCIAAYASHPQLFVGDPESISDFIDAHLGIRFFPKRHTRKRGGYKPKPLTDEQKRAFPEALKEVSELHSVPQKLIVGRSREKWIVAARQELMRRLHELGWSSTQIGEKLSRDHATVLHGLKTGVAREVALAKYIDKLARHKLRARP